VPGASTQKPSESSTTGGVFESLKKGASGLGDVISKGASSAADFATKNKGLVGMGIEGAAAYGGYQAGKSSREAQTELAKQQLQESQRIGAELGKIQYPGQMYSAETGNIQEAIAKGGMTPELARASELAKRSGMSIAAGGMKAASDLAARTGGRATAGSALLGSMLGAQMGGGKAADIEANIGVEASKNKIEQLRRLSDIESQKFKEESGLAQTKDVLAASRAGQTAGARGSLMDIESDAGTAKANLFGAGANLAQTAIGNTDLGQLIRSRTGEAAPAQAPRRHRRRGPQGGVRLEPRRDGLCSAWWLPAVRVDLGDRVPLFRGLRDVASACMSTALQHGCDRAAAGYAMRGAGWPDTVRGTR
jgi:hypothetical protein